MNTKLFNQYAADPSAFRDALNVDVNGTVHRFGDIMDDWQRDDFALIDPALKLCNGRAKKPAINRIYLERPRGHSKTTDLAVTVCWALAFASRPVKGYAFAADRDQAGLLKDAVDTILRLNPWLGTILEVQKGQVLNIAKGHPGEGARLEISTSDVGSSYGILPDFIIADELTHWMPAGEQLWHSLISSAAKRTNCLLCVISNAGFVDDWTWKTRETARVDEAWHFSRLDGPHASWITEERLAEQQRMLPGLAFNRLWLNEWSLGGGDALTKEVIEAAFIPGLTPINTPEPGWSYVAGLDLGLTRDHSACVVLGVPEGGVAGKIRLCHHRMWIPQKNQKINLLEVEQHLLNITEQFNLEFIAFDPWQAVHLAQAIEADTDKARRNMPRRFYTQPFMRELPPTPANLREQAHRTIEFFNDRRIQLYDCPDLKRDLIKLRVEEKNYGMRLTSPRDGDGHGDCFSAFALALLIAHELAGVGPVVAGTVTTPNSYAEAFRQRQLEYQAEQEFFSKPDRADDPFRYVMNMLGRGPENRNF